MMNGYKTLIFNAFLAAWGVVEAFDWVSVVGDQKAGLMLIGIGAIGAVLRFVTKTPVVGGEVK